MPVYNSLSLVTECIGSILQCTLPDDYHLHVIDDCSDTVTGNYLAAQAEKHPQISVCRNSQNLGFVKSCNIGITLGQAPYVVLINSDVIVTPDWLYRLIACAESDTLIASVNPLTNHASNINIPMVPGANFYGMDEVLENSSPTSYPDVVTGVGFCMLLRRSALDEVGLFDEVYGRGYCEESDLCMRLTSRGYRTVVADNVYVFHKGRASFIDRGERYKQNRKIFDLRWKNEYNSQFKVFHSENPLKSVRDLFLLKQRWDPGPSMRETYRRMRDQMRQREYSGMIRETARGIRRLHHATRDIVTPDSVDRVTRPDRLRVTYVLHNLTVAGGVLSAVQLVNELILLGVEARIVALYEYPEIYDWKFFTRPIVFRTVSELLENFPETDIAVATHWTTAPWVADVMKSGRAGTGVYFIQDYESWFFPEEDEESRTRVNKTYELISHKIVKSDWLKGLLAKGSFSAQKIHLGMDLSMFYPRDIKKASRPIILAMARPRTPRRGYKYVISALHQVKRKRPDADIILFGDHLEKKSIPFNFTDAGVLTDQNRLAELYSKADVFLDGSDYQGFGRTALEAMACGAACVITNVGGVTEYAVDGYNCLTVPPREPGLFSDAILKILEDSELKAGLIKGGFATVKDYCYKREARETLEYFETIIR